MRRLLITGVSALFALGLGGCAQIEQWTGQSDSTAAAIPQSATSSISTLSPSDMIGKSVVAYDGKSVGEVEDVILSSANRASQVVVSTGGFLGMGSKSVALDADNLRYARDRDALVATQMTQEQVGALPEFQYGSNMMSLSRARRTQ